MAAEAGDEGCAGRPPRDGEVGNTMEASIEGFGGGARSWRGVLRKKIRVALVSENFFFKKNITSDV
jgi:hypothetical protein